MASKNTGRRVKNILSKWSQYSGVAGFTGANLGWRKQPRANENQYEVQILTLKNRFERIGRVTHALFAAAHYEHSTLATQHVYVFVFKTFVKYILKNFMTIFKIADIDFRHPFEANLSALKIAHMEAMGVLSKRITYAQFREKYTAQYFTFLMIGLMESLGNPKADIVGALIAKITYQLLNCYIKKGDCKKAFMTNLDFQRETQTFAQAFVSNNPAYKVYGKKYYDKFKTLSNPDDLKNWLGKGVIVPFTKFVINNQNHIQKETLKQTQKEQKDSREIRLKTNATRRKRELENFSNQYGLNVQFPRTQAKSQKTLKSSQYNNTENFQMFLRNFLNRHQTKV